MSRYSDAQYELVYAIIEDVAENRGFGEADADELRSLVFADDRLWDSEIWGPVYELVEDHAADVE